MMDFLWFTMEQEDLSVVFNDFPCKRDSKSGEFMQNRGPPFSPWSNNQCRLLSAKLEKDNIQTSTNNRMSISAISQDNFNIICRSFIVFHQNALNFRKLHRFYQLKNRSWYRENAVLQISREYHLRKIGEKLIANLRISYALERWKAFASFFKLFSILPFLKMLFQNLVQLNLRNDCKSLQNRWGSFPINFFLLGFWRRMFMMSSALFSTILWRLLGNRWY